MVGLITPDFMTSVIENDEVTGGSLSWWNISLIFALLRRQKPN